MINKGDTIGIIALSGNCDTDKINESKANIESLGFNVRLSKNIFSKARYLAGSDEDKISDLHEFFLDRDIKLILCARGGYGAIRLINKIDYDIIKSNPKIFCGFSDVTALLLMIYKKTQIVTYHGPMACTDFTGMSTDSLLSIETIDCNKDYTIYTFLQAINNKPLSYEGTKIYNTGKAEGILWGGNLATVVSLCGQDFLPDNDFIFFAEDLNEPVYKIDRMFQQLININQFAKHCKGIILGDFLDTDNNEWLEEYFYELASRTHLPVISGFRISHAKEKITLPIGKHAILQEKNLSVF